MRISTSDQYYHPIACDLDPCERHYCPEHRVLWRDCDTAKKDFRAYELGDCPACEADFRQKQNERMFQEWEQREALEIDKSIDADMEHQRHGV